jgi:GT2 family glycosyltransferase
MRKPVFFSGGISDFKSRAKNEGNMASPFLSIHIATWNGMDVFPEFCASLDKQTVGDCRVLIVDNGSTDEVETFVRAQMSQAVFLRNPKNLGFAAAHNQGIRFALEHWQGENLSERFILVANQDLLLMPTFLEELLKDARAHPEAGAWGGKLLRAFREPAGEEGWKETIRSDVIDTTGLRASRGGAFFERGAGEMDRGQYDRSEEVFGVSGAVVLFRAQALEDVRDGQEFFDADFFSYKEDIDLCWRLRRAGWEIRYVPSAVAYHHRGMSGSPRSSWWKRLRERRGQSTMRRYWSLRNHSFLLIKNMSFLEGLALFPWLFARELTRFLFVLFFEPRHLKAFVDPWLLWPRLWRKRRKIQSSRRVPHRALLRWFHS